MPLERPPRPLRGSPRIGAMAWMQPLMWSSSGMDGLAQSARDRSRGTDLVEPILRYRSRSTPDRSGIDGRATGPGQATGPRPGIWEQWALKVGTTGRIKALQEALAGAQGWFETRSLAGIRKAFQVPEAVPSGRAPGPRNGAGPDASRSLKYLGTVGFSLLSHTGVKIAKWSKRRLCRLMAARAI